MRGLAALALLASPALAEGPADAPGARRASALAALPPVAESAHAAAQCAGFFWAVGRLNADLPRLARHGLGEPWPAGQPEPFAWVEAADVDAWRSFTPLPPGTPNFIQLYLDAFGSPRWTVANLPLYQRDKAACLAMVGGVAP